MTVLLDQPLGPGPVTDPGPNPKKRGGGPRTPEGREASKRNSLKHGLRAREVLTADLAAAAARRTTEFVAEFAPRTPYETQLVKEMALASAQLDHCQDLMLVDYQRCIDRAEHCWDLDCGVYIDTLGARLHKEPRRVARALGRSKHGCDHLLENWEGLAGVLRTHGCWDEPQRRLAFDLLGVPHEFRAGHPALPAAADAATLAAVVDAEMTRLRDDQEAVLIDLDESTRAMAISGMPFEEDPQTARLRKYEARIRRARTWAHAELRRVQTGTAGASFGHAPAPHSEPPEVAPRPSMSNAAQDYQLRRSRLASESCFGANLEEPEVAGPPEPAPGPVLDPEPWVVSETLPNAAADAADDASPFFSAPGLTLGATLASLPLSPAPRNRRERLTRAKHSRLGARPGAR